MKKPGKLLPGVILKLGLTIGMVLGSTTLFAGYRFNNGLWESQFNSSAGITLNQDIHADRGARVYIQNGKVVRMANENFPYCYFRLYRSSDDLGLPVDIQATTFQVVNIRNFRRMVQIRPSISIDTQFISFIGGFMQNGGGSHFTFVTEINLSDPAQPQVRKLVCAIWAESLDRSYVNLEEIHQTLGSLVTIEKNQ